MPADPIGASRGVRADRSRDLAGDAGHENRQASSGGGSQMKGPNAAFLTVDPNPVPAGRGTGATTIRWDTGDGSVGQVYVSGPTGAEVLFVQGVSGAREAAWILAGRNLETRRAAPGAPIGTSSGTPALSTC